MNAGGFNPLAGNPLRSRDDLVRGVRALDAALREALPDDARWQLPAAGSALWLRLPRAADPDRVWRGLLDAGIAAVRGDVFHVDGAGRDHLHLGVANLDEAGLAEGAALLGRVVKRAARKRRAA
ncbi:MAG: hypothetical protein JRF70_02865 [Deltaproteobacteria bacterium]|nr:hypothetical protein [Deltaproteobacteria bacterium]